jgi:hypothetical protein
VFSIGFQHLLWNSSGSFLRILVASIYYYPSLV